MGAHPNPRFHGMRTFFIRRDKEGTDATGVAAASAAPPSAGARASSLRDEDFSYVRCVDNVSAIDTQAAKAICSVLNKVRLLITPMLAMLMLFSDALLVDEAAAVVLPLLQVVAAFPSVGTVLLEKLRRAFPPLKTPPETHQAFAKSMLLLSSQLPSVGGVSRRGEGRTLRTNFSEKEPASLSATQLRGALWRLLLSKMVLIDSEIKSADPYRVDAEQLAVWKVGNAFQRRAPFLSRDLYSESSAELRLFPCMQSPVRRVCAEGAARAAVSTAAAWKFGPPVRAATFAETRTTPAATLCTDAVRGRRRRNGKESRCLDARRVFLSEDDASLSQTQAQRSCPRRSCAGIFHGADCQRQCGGLLSLRRRLASCVSGVSLADDGRSRRWKRARQNGSRRVRTRRLRGLPEGGPSLQLQ